MKEYVFVSVKRTSLLDYNMGYNSKKVFWHWPQIGWLRRPPLTEEPEKSIKPLFSF